jgi:hypothetical protein
MKRIALCLLLTPLHTYVMLVTQKIVTQLLAGGVITDASYRPDSFEIELVLILAALSFAQLASLLIPLPSQPSRGEPVPILSRALLGGFLVTAAIFIPLAALLDIPSYFSNAESPPAIGISTVRGVIAAWALSWIFFTGILTYRSQTPGSDTIERAVKQATIGTAVGLALATPWYLVLRRKQACVCALGTFYSLLVGIWSLIMIGGPLLFMVRRDRRHRNATQGTPSV